MLIDQKILPYHLGIVLLDIVSCKSCDIRGESLNVHCFHCTPIQIYCILNDFKNKENQTVIWNQRLLMELD